VGKSINRVTLVGNVGKDPEIKTTQSGFAIATFSVACNYRVKDGENGWKDEVEWVPVKAFGKTAEAIEKYVRKGDRIAVEGRFVTESWEDRQSGEKRYKSQVNADDVVFLTSKNESGGRRSSGDDRPARAAPAKPAEEKTPGDSSGFYDEDLPF
jgi:single-strand DNA-binding protein